MMSICRSEKIVTTYAIEEGDASYNETYNFPE